MTKGHNSLGSSKKAQSKHAITSFNTSNTTLPTFHFHLCLSVCLALSIPLSVFVSFHLCQSPVCAVLLACLLFLSVYQPLLSLAWCSGNGPRASTALVAVLLLGEPKGTSQVVGFARCLGSGRASSESTSLWHGSTKDSSQMQALVRGNLLDNLHGEYLQSSKVHIKSFNCEATSAKNTNNWRRLQTTAHREFAYSSWDNCNQSSPPALINDLNSMQI